MYKILLVEDETIISEPFGMVLRSQGYHVDAAFNGLEALDFCKNQSYDLILLDAMMPFCNGVEFLKKADLKTRSPDTRVVMLSNLAGGKEINEALELGAEENILKSSITPKSLVELVRSKLSPATNSRKNNR